MKFNKLIQLGTLALTLGVAAANAGATPKYYRGDLIHSNQPFTRVGGDRIVFGYRIAKGCNVDALKEAAISLKHRNTTDRWDDLWYAFHVERGRCLMIGWYNLDDAKYGWAAIQNQPNAWTVRSNRKGWQTLPNGEQMKYSFSINSQGVDLDIFNPNNAGALTGDDILISFGY